MTKYFAPIAWALLTLHPLSGQLDYTRVNNHLPPLLDSLDSRVRAGDYEAITSILIARHGEVRYEKYYNGADVNAGHNTRSATKTIATLLTGLAIREGYVQSEQDYVKDYLGLKWPVKNPDARKDSITLEDLLTMSSVLECNDQNPYSRGNEERMYPIEDWTQFLLDLPVRSYPWGPPPEERPYGRAWSYCTAGAAAMAAVVESAVGQPAHEFAQQYLLEPLGITDYRHHFSPQGTLNTAGGSEYRSRDFLKLIQLCLQGGVWEGQRIIPADWLKKATTPKAEVEPGVEYGYLFWLESFGATAKYPTFYMSGNGGQKIVAVPDLDLAVVITTTNYNKRNAHPYTDEILNQYVIPAMAEE
ncbi:serine hydrolase domain-containing protein [Lewinella sp. IMCC34191]|uniref:serine hydrolase domain-containing protein n=1 Tax=Lewinella sp. IMCC34191 TaxID=2259172 RepID=UPI000E2620CC|nr:serine hydrolase [Lewinella sp. IMCC34191]